MEKMILAIKERIEECKASRSMFTMPSLNGYTVSEEELQCSGSVLHHCVHTVSLPDGRTIRVDYQSKDKCKTFSVEPDRSCIQVVCSDHSNDFSDSWDEK